MKTNTYVRSFSLVATKSGDPIANAVADMLRENRSLQSLNIESNFISSTGLMAVLKAVRENATLTELRVDNQRQWPGDAVEMEMATVLEQCPSIVRFGYHFTQQGPRARAAHAMTRNNELHGTRQHLMSLPKERKETHPCQNNKWSSVYGSSFPGRQQKKR